MIDVNCDMGELPHLLADGTEEALMQKISSANVSCGGHAGSAESMESLVKLALKYRVELGAHVSYPDRDNFGRREMAMSPAKLEDSIYSQISLLAEIAKGHGVRVSHVKPHGALYHAAQRGQEIAT